MNDQVPSAKYRISGYISDEIRQAIEASADARDCSVSYLVELALKNLVDENIVSVELDPELSVWLKAQAKRGFRSPEEHLTLLVAEAKEKSDNANSGS
jgi:hypothetical protein